MPSLFSNARPTSTCSSLVLGLMLSASPAVAVVRTPLFAFVLTPSKTLRATSRNLSVQLASVLVATPSCHFSVAARIIESTMGWGWGLLVLHCCSIWRDLTTHQMFSVLKLI